MVNQLDYTPVSANPNMRVDFYPSNGFANYASPTVTELNAGTNLSKAISWNSFSFKLNSSTTTNDPSLADAANVTDRGAIQYGGNMSFYYPGPGTLSTDSYQLAYAALSQPRVVGYIVLRVDGNKPTTQAYAAGDIVHVFLVETDAQTNEIVGESAFMYTVGFISQGTAAIHTIATTGAPTVVLSPTTLSLTAAGSQKSRIKATVNAREYTNGVVWTSSDVTKASVSGAGVVTAKAAGSVTITATYANSGATSSCTVTVS